MAAKARVRDRRDTLRNTDSSPDPTVGVVVAECAPHSPAGSPDGRDSRAAPTFRAADVVEIVTSIPGRKELAAGQRAVVVVGNEADAAGIWHMVSIVLGRDPERGKAYLVRPRHLRLVARPVPTEGAP